MEIDAEFSKLNKTCEYCGKPLIRRYYEKSKTFETLNNYKKRKYCDRKCKLRAKALEKKNSISPKICKQCGKEFIPSKDDKRIRFCSEECQLEHRRVTGYMNDYQEKNKEKLKAYNQSEERKEKKNKDRREKYQNDEEYRERQKKKAIEYNRRNPDRKLNQHLSKYGLTKDEYNQMIEKQNHRCLICGSEGDLSKPHRPLYVDHNHITGKIRGLLCQNCNFMIGQARDDIEILEKGIRYLKEHDEV